MPTFKLRANELSGETGLTVQLFPPGGTIANGAGGDSLSESSGLFSATVAETLSGFHQYYVYQSGNPIYSGFVYCNGSTWYADQPSEGTTYPPLYRSADDTQDIRFLWPVDDDTITATVSINGATPVAVSGAITQTALTANGQYFYELAYDADDRPTAEGTALYVFSGNGYTGYLTLEVSPSLSNLSLITPEGVVYLEAGGTNISLKTGCTKVKRVAVEDDLRGKTLKLYVWTMDRRYFDEFTVTAGNLYFEFTPSTALVATERDFHYALREPSDGNNPIRYGLLEVDFIADDAS